VNAGTIIHAVMPLFDSIECKAYWRGHRAALGDFAEQGEVKVAGDDKPINVGKITDCLDQLTDLLIAAGKCQDCDTPRKVTLAKRELGRLVIATQRDETNDPSILLSNINEDAKALRTELLHTQQGASILAHQAEDTNRLNKDLVKEIEHKDKTIRNLREAEAKLRELMLCLEKRHEQVLNILDPDRSIF
jgi:hypothetical protein